MLLMDNLRRNHEHKQTWGEVNTEIVYEAQINRTIQGTFPLLLIINETRVRLDTLGSIQLLISTFLTKMKGNQCCFSLFIIM